MSAIKIRLPTLYLKQYNAIYAPERYSWIEGSTKSGKTAGCMTWILDRALQGRDGDNYWWVAPVSAVSQIAFDRLRGRDFLKKVPNELYVVNLTEKSISIKNAGKIWFKSADKPDSLYGEDVYDAVIDEGSRCKPQAFDAVRSTLTFTGGQIRIIGNVRGRGNWFYKGCRSAQAGRLNHAYHKITADDAVSAGVFPQAELDDARATFEAQGRLHVYKELYMCEPSDDGGNPFGLTSILECTVGDATGPDTVISDLPPEVWGWDLARSVDWTVGVALDVNGAVCRFERWQKTTWKHTENKILQLTDAPALVDSSGVGDPIVENLQKANAEWFEGFKFSSPSKQKLMEGLAISIGLGEVSYGEGVLRNELDSFEYEHKRTHTLYSAPSGLHDDAVMAFALAVKHVNRAAPRNVVALFG